MTSCSSAPQYSGYLKVDGPFTMNEYDSLSIHYQFHESQGDPKTDPIATVRAPRFASVFRFRSPACLRAVAPGRAGRLLDRRRALHRDGLLPGRLGGHAHQRLRTRGSLSSRGFREKI